MRYEVVKGDPHNGECRIEAYDGTRLLAAYRGWYEQKEDRWRLYPLDRRIGTIRYRGKFYLSSREVSLPQPTQKQPEPMPEWTQLRLIL